MSSNIQTTCGNIKAKPDISNSAKLLGGYMTATGITDAKTISETLNIPLRTVQRLKLEYATCATDGVLICANSANDATGGVSESAKCATDGVLVRVDNNIITTLEFSEVSEVITPLVPQAVAIEAPAIAEPTSKKRKNGTRLPADWTLPHDWRQWTRVNFPHSTDERVTFLADEFRDYWISAPRGTKLDWEATWRNRCRQMLSTAPIRPHAQPPPRQLSDREIRTQQFKAALAMKRQEVANVPAN